MSDDIGVDLSGVTATGGVTATESAGGTFTQDADLGAAVVTITGGIVDLQAAGVDGVDASTFIVNGGTLVVTHAQVDAISNTASITGTSGNVTVIAGSDSTTGVSALSGSSATDSTALVKVVMTGGGTLTFDLPADDNDTLVLEAGSVINFGTGGTLVVADGTLDARNLSTVADGTGSSDWSGIENVVVNSGLSMTVQQLNAATSVETGGAGRLEIVIEEASDLDLLQTIITEGAGNKLTSGAKPALTLTTSADATDAGALEAQIIAKAPVIAAAANIAVPVKTLDGGMTYTSPDLDIEASSDGGVSSTDNVSSAKIPLMKVILPNENISLVSGDTITIRVETYNGTTFTVVSTDIITLDAVEGSATNNVSTDANGNSFVRFNARDLDAINGDGSYYITALASSSAVTDLPSNKVMYVLDTTGPTATIDVGTPLLGAEQTSKVTIVFSEKVMAFDPSTDVVLSDSAAGSLSGFTSADGGMTWTADFTPTSGLASGSTTITLNN